MVSARPREAEGFASALRARPLAPLAGGFILGIVAARGLEYSLTGPLIFLGLLAVFLSIRWRTPAVLALLGLALGGLRQEWTETRKPERATDRLEGIVEGPPKVYRSLDDPAEVPRTDGTFRVGRVQVRYYRKAVDLIGGEKVVVTGRMRNPRGATNPGQFDYAAYLRNQGVDHVMTLDEITVLEGPSLLHRTRAALRELFNRGMRPEVAAFESAILLGRREALPDDLVTRFQRSGTAHLLAISGQHLAIVALSAWVLLTVFGIRDRPKTITLLVALGIYVLLSGARLPVTRAYLMLAIYFGADLLWRRRDGLSALSAAALILCAWDPAQIADVGFQLSFSAVLGLMYLAPVFHAWTESGGGLWNWLRTGLGVSAAAWLATAPIVLANFNLLTPAVIPANLLLVPLIAVQLVIGLLHLPLALVGAGAVTGFAAGLVFDLVSAISGAITALPFSYVYAPPAPTALILAYTAALVAWTAWCRGRPAAPWKIACALLLVAPLGLTGPLRHRAPEGVHLAVLDVGRGSCAYLEWPDGRNMMIDCGSLNVRDPGASIAARYLWNRGVTTLDTLVLSHPDADHVNGADSLLDLLRVRRVMVTRAFDSWAWPDRVEVVVVERDGPTPERIGDLEILGPPVWEKYGGTVPANETSIVLRVAGVLFPGDIEERGAAEVLSLPDVRAGVLVMPHHGKFFRQHEEFVRRVAPETILVSAPEGYFSPRVIDALPVEPRITGREGAIEMVLPPAP